MESKTKKRQPLEKYLLGSTIQGRGPPNNSIAVSLPSIIRISDAGTT